MHSFRNILKGASFLSASEIVAQGCSFARNVILARFLAKADFGVAAVLGMVLTLFEMCSKMALSQQVIQSKHGDDKDFVACVHFAQLAAGVASALLILMAAWPFSHFFAGGHYMGSIMALALIPFVSGLNNLDVYRHARQLGFGPLVLTDVVPQLITTLAAWPLAAWLRDYRAVLCVLLGKAFLSAGMTHLLAERPFSVRMNTRWLRETLHFGLPLLLSGFVQFGNFQGDSMVIAGAYSLVQLGEYSVAMTMAMAPGLAVLRIGGSISLPLLASVQAEPERFQARYSLYVQSLALLGCAITLGMLLCGEQVVVLLFGAKYAGIGALASFLVGAQAVRIIRGATVSAAMARGDTVNNLVSNLWRLSGLAAALVIAWAKLSLFWFAGAGFFGEMVALVAAVIRLRSAHQITARATLLPTFVSFCLVCACSLVVKALGLGPMSVFNWLLLPVALGISIAAFSALFGEIRNAAKQWSPARTWRLRSTLWPKAVR